MHPRIRRAIERIPYDMMAVPLALGALLPACAPGIPEFFGVSVGASFEVKATFIAAAPATTSTPAE